LLADIRKDFVTHRWVYIVSILYIVINSFFIANKVYWFLLVPFALLISYAAFTSLDKILLLIVFLTPLSVPLENYYPTLGFNLQLITEPLLIMVMIIFGYRIILERNFDRKLLVHPISWIIYFQLTWMLITSITSSMPLVSFKFLISRLWFLTSFYFLAMIIFRSKTLIRRYIWMYLPALIIVIIYAFINLVQNGFLNQKAAHLAATPFFKDHTSYGAILAMLIPVVIGLAMIKKYSVPFRILIWIILIVLCFALLFSYTRAAWISLVIAAVVFIIIKSRISLKIFGIIFFLIMLILLSYRTEILLKLEQNKQDSSKDFAKHIESISNIRTDASNLERINRWNCAFRMYHERPIFGWGPGTYMFQYAPFQASKEKTIISTNLGDWGNAHSEYIGPMAESGFFGIAGMLLFAIAVLYTGFKVYFKAKPNSQVRILSLAITLGLITYFVHGSLNDFLDTDKASALFWGYIAMLVAMDVYHLKKNNEITS
jgi:putative inorganic carbon (hco3(-)) transporter